MGNTSSTTNLIKSSTNMSLMQSFVTNNILQTTTDVSNIQTLNINIVDADGCPIRTNQNITNSVQIKTNIDNTGESQLQNDLMQSLQSTLSQNASMVNGFAAATGGNSTNVTNEITNAINVAIRNEVTVNNIQQTATRSYNSQSGTLTMYFCRNSPIEMNQTIVSNVISQNVLTNVQKALLKNSTVSNLISYADQTASMQNKGLDDVIKAIGDAISGFIKAYAMICVGIVAVCCIGILAILFMGSSGGNSPPPAAPA